MMINPLEPLTFPLQHSRLIEASAGTGKTFTLALLYVRLVLGHGGAATGFVRPLTPPEILVVTFTDAATKELRERIRGLLVAAANCFDEEPAPTHAATTLLLQLRASYASAEWLTCAARLRLAAQWMDEAVILTIHSWCYRMLQEHAFATRGLFQRELVTDQSEVLAEVVRDYWRIHFYPLSPTQAALVVKAVGSPAELQKKLRLWLHRREAVLTYCGQPLRCASLTAPLAAAQRQAELERTARDIWHEQRLTVEAVLRELREHLNGKTHNSAQVDKFEDLLAAIALWAAGGAEPTALKHFAAGAFQFKKTAKVQTEVVHPAFQALAAWRTALSTVPLAATVTAHAAQWVGAELERRLVARAEMGFDDLLRQLDAALNSCQLSGGVAPTNAAVSLPTENTQLAATIRAQFPVALIDEFQDTDPIQYRIFDRIYQVAQPHPDTALILIGDPKQAIYSFRGADIQTYLCARAATAGRHHTLAVNYRSTSAVVAACAALFAPAETCQRGAFRCKTNAGNPIPLHPVQAHGQPQQLQLNGQPAPALTLWWLDGDDDAPVQVGAYREQMAAAAARQIVAWLAQAQQGLAGFQHDSAWTPLRPKDIAILVRTGTEAIAMQRALAAQQIHSVYLSDRESVFATEEASDLRHWLRAVAAPTDDSLVRAALGTNTLQLPLTWLAQLQQDELAWEAQIERFRSYQLRWQQHGVLAMLRQLLQDFELPTRLLAEAGGERVLTNLLHLAEWLQQAALALDGEQALIRHLAEQLTATAADTVPDAFIQRLESDAELVQIITIHKAKGLEYPLVLLPFICSWREVDGNTRQVFYHDGASTRLELADKKLFEPAWEAADDARLSEDVRLLYVAVTRARHALWLGIAPLKGRNGKTPQLEKSAFGYLLNGGETFADVAAVRTALAALPARCADIVLTPLPELADAAVTTAAALTLESARMAQKARLPSWWIASYSSLKRHGGGQRHSLPAQETAREETMLEEATAATAVDEHIVEQFSLHGLPRGSRQGTFLHALLEWAGQCQVVTATGEHLTGFAAAATADSERLALVTTRCRLHGLTDWVPVLDAWLARFLTQRWNITGFALRDLTLAQCQIEMEFWLEIHHVTTTQLDQLVQQHCLAGYARPALEYNVLNGMLKGFIDLICEYDGRYYIVDWKSNYLGATAAAYTEKAMRDEILHSRYDLQYVLYVLALHRLLTARLPNYNYDRDLGGAIYVFLRGIEAPSQGLFFDKPPRQLIETLDRLFFSGGR
ncbi:exodeoxyribonuclease V subunit beta [Chromatium okenii]|uniref:exodeoxyribonuclease V subunit beta n=1 Tax=Chromatium okenii TaxID=61644 RepID=UPI001F5BA962|nr:exodeoxyribonuclease V subunit beta [Chromatium okenii]